MGQAVSGLTDEEVMMPPAPTPERGFTDDEVMREPPISEAAMPAVKSAVEQILNAMGQGFREGFGPDRLGLPDEDVRALSKIGMFAPEGQKHYSNPFHAFNELLVETIWRTGELAVRGTAGAFRAAQAGIAATGEAVGQPRLGRELAAIPEAFLGSPHPIGIPKTLPVAPELRAARDLGVIGPEPKPVREQLAEPQRPAKTMAAAQNSDDVLRGPEPTGGDPWRDRFEKFVGKLETHDQVKDLITEAADAHGDFPAARRGDIPLAQIDGLSQVTGIAPEELQAQTSGIGRILKNDNQVRTAMQLMIKAGEDVREAMAAVDRKGGVDDLGELQTLQQAIMRRDLAVEQIVGLRAEWGRTGNVFQEFMEASKDAQGFGKWLNEKKGRSLDDLRDLARDGRGLNDPEALQRFLQEKREPNAWDKAIWYWVNALISGPITHAKYVMANAAFAGYEGAVVQPIAATLGAARKITGIGAEDRVLAGEPAARLWGLVAGTPDALRAAVQAAKTGLQTPLPGELAQNIVPKQNKNVFFQQTPIPGTLGKIIGAPSRGASAIHSFFNFLGYRAELEQQAYRAAAKEGLSPRDDGFWQRRQAMVDNPTKEMMDSAIEEGYRLTFINELGPTAKKVAAAVNSYPPFRLIMPFVHIPFNVLKRGVDNTALGLFSKEVRDDVLGKNGVPKQDKAIARIVAGSAVGAWMMNQVLNDNLTGYGPTDQKERALWLLTHQPYSVRIGHEWVSYNRFGPLGTLVGLHANLGEVLPHIKWDGEEATKAAALLVHATGRLMEDEVGMQGLAGLMDAIDEPERKGTRFIAQFAASWLPYSSFQRQTAAFMDPDMREAKTFIDGIKYTVPGARQTLLPKRDWTGIPVENPAYHSLIRSGTASTDPLALEMQALDIKPTPPSDRIGGVKLTPELYDKYQSTAGPFTRMTLESMVKQPGWHDLPPMVRENVFHAAIKSTRAAAAAMMQAAHPEIIQQGVDDRLARIRGEKPKRKLQ